MELLSPSQCSSWLSSRAITESPYSAALPIGVQYARFASVAGQAVAAAVTSAVLPVQPGTEALLQVTDWSSYVGSQLPVVLQALQVAFPQESSTYGRLGLTINPQEQGALLESCAFILANGLSAYVYSVVPSVTAYLWEGELVELWSPSAATIGRISEVLVEAGAIHVARNGG